LMHQSWQADEVEVAVARHGKRPVEHLADLGVLGQSLSLVHMIHIDDHELELAAEAGTAVIHFPSASLLRAPGAIRVRPIAEMLRRGMTVALGSDGYSGRRDLARQVYLVATLFDEIRGESLLVTPQGALEMATVHGAHALGMAEEVGSLEIGKRADLVIQSL